MCFHGEEHKLTDDWNWRITGRDRNEKCSEWGFCRHRHIKVRCIKGRKKRQRQIRKELNMKLTEEEFTEIMQVIHKVRKRAGQPLVIKGKLVKKFLNVLNEVVNSGEKNGSNYTGNT